MVLSYIVTKCNNFMTFYNYRLQNPKKRSSDLHFSYIAYTVLL